MKAAAKKAGGGRRIRFSVPMSIRCRACNGFIAKGRKLNVAKTRSCESGVDVFRFAFPCPHCRREVRVSTCPLEGSYRLDADA